MSHTIIYSCNQHDSKSDIVDQRISCEGRVVAILYEAHNRYDQVVAEGVSTVCEAHMHSWIGRDLKSQGFTLGNPLEIGVIGGALSLDFEREH